MLNEAKGCYSVGLVEFCDTRRREEIKIRQNKKKIFTFNLGVLKFLRFLRFLFL